MSNTFASTSISNISIVTFTVERSLCIYTLGVYCTVSKLCRTFVLVYKEERKVRAKNWQSEGNFPGFVKILPN